jgi:hypothetical protein
MDIDQFTRYLRTKLVSLKVAQFALEMIEGVENCNIPVGCACWTQLSAW